MPAPDANTPEPEAAEAEVEVATTPTERPFRIRTITAFVTLGGDDFRDGSEGAGGPGTAGKTGVETKIDDCCAILRALEERLVGAGYEVQSVRVATNPFGEWLIPAEDGGKKGGGRRTDAPGAGGIDERLRRLDGLLEARNIVFCNLGPSLIPWHTAEICPRIVAASGRLSCSASVEAGDADAAQAAARCMRTISSLGRGGEGDAATLLADHLAGGLGNFRFCAVSRVRTVPFFPGARAPPPPSDGTGDTSPLLLAIGLENGAFARRLMEEAECVGGIRGVFHTKMREALLPVQDICLNYVDAADRPVEYLGLDTSLNPSLDDGGSVAEALECLEEVQGDFGGAGSLAAAAAVATSLQSIPGVRATGYCGLMLPILEDRRLAELGGTSRAPGGRLTAQALLSVSSVCGVGIDTVPVPGDVGEGALASLILDVAALAGRWDKPLSCRVFPVPGGRVGEETAFDSPYMCNSRIFDL